MAVSAPVSGREADPERVSTDASSQPDEALVFRAVSASGQRRGLRLEAIYWTILKSIAKAGRQSIGAVVGEIADQGAIGTNLASMLRVRSARWLMNRVAVLEHLTRPDISKAIVQASPSPAFALTEDRRILFYNAAFLNLIQVQMQGSSPNLLAKGLRLSLDVQLEDVLATLSSGQATTVASGYVIGLEGQRIRGTVNIVLAPLHEQTVVIAFVARN